MLARFMVRYPGINLQLEATNRRVDLVGEGVDVAIRVRPRPFDDSDLVLRVLAQPPLIPDRCHQRGGGARGSPHPPLPPPNHPAGSLLPAEG